MSDDAQYSLLNYGTINPPPEFSGTIPRFKEIAISFIVITITGFGLSASGDSSLSTVGTSLAILGILGFFVSWVIIKGRIPLKRIKKLKKAIQSNGIRVRMESSNDRQTVRLYDESASEKNTYVSTIERVRDSGLDIQKYSIEFLNKYAVQFAKGVFSKMNYLLIFNASGEALYAETLSNIYVGVYYHRKVTFGTLRPSHELSELFNKANDLSVNANMPVDAQKTVEVAAIRKDDESLSTVSGKEAPEPENIPIPADGPTRSAPRSANKKISKKQIVAILIVVIIVVAAFTAFELTSRHTMPPVPGSAFTVSGTPTSISSIGEFWAWQLSGPTNGSVEALPTGTYTITDSMSQQIYVIVSDVMLPSASAGNVPSDITNSTYHAYVETGSITITLNSSMYVSVLFTAVGSSITIKTGSTDWSAASYNGSIGSHGSGGQYYTNVWATPSTNGLDYQIAAYSCTGIGSGIVVGQTGFVVSSANTCNGDSIE